MNVVDLVLIIAVAVIAIISAKKGFLLALLNIAAYVVSGILAKLFSSPAVAYIYENFFSEKILLKLQELIPSGSVEGELQSIILNAIQSLPEPIASLVSHFNGVEIISSVTFADTALTVDTIEQTYVAPFVSSTLSVVVMVVLFILFSFVLRFVFSVINKLVTGKKHKMIRGANMFFGAALGVVKGSFIVGIISAVLNLAAPVINNPQFSDFVNGSAICNIIADLLK